MNSPTRWAVRVDWSSTLLADTEAEAILTKLADLRPTLSVDATDNPRATRYRLTTSIEDTSLRQAIATALRRVEDTTGQKATGVEAITHEEAVRRLEAPHFPELVGNSEIAEILGVSRQRAAQLTEQKGFPGAVVTTKNGALRVRSAVEDWAANWKRQAGRPRKDASNEDDADA